MRILIVATLLILVPLGARGADLVVWWEQGVYPQVDEAVREIIAAVEQKTGKEVEFVQPGQYEVGDEVQAALEAGRPPDFLYATLSDWTARWAYEDQLADLEGALGPVLDLFDPDAVEAAMLLDSRTGRRGVHAALERFQAPVAVRGRIPSIAYSRCAGAGSSPQSAPWAAAPAR